MQQAEQPVFDSAEHMIWAPRSDARRRTRSPSRVALRSEFAAQRVQRPTPMGDAAVGLGADDEIIRIQATFPIRSAGDATVARQYARSFAEQKGFNAGDQIVIDAVLGEMAMNLLSFAGAGEFVFGTATSGDRSGILIVVRDQGPGIPDVPGALADGYSTASRPGLGLSASRRLMDSFQVASAAGQGTTITMKKWLDSAG